MSVLSCPAASVGIQKFLVWDVPTSSAVWKDSPICNVGWSYVEIESGVASGNSALVELLFTDPDYISAFSLGCLGAWGIGVMFGQIFKYIGRLKP